VRPSIAALEVVNVALLGQESIAKSIHCRFMYETFSILSVSTFQLVLYGG
jgi:hypothetical protein